MEEQKQKKKKKQKNRDDAKRYKIAGVVAVIAGIIELISALLASSGMDLIFGLTFCCLGYLFYNMGKRAAEKKGQR